MGKVLKTSKAKYNFKLDGGITDWILLSLAWLVVSVVTFGIGMPFITIYVVKTIIGSLEVTKVEEFYIESDYEETKNDFKKEREERLKNL